MVRYRVLSDPAKLPQSLAGKRRLLGFQMVFLAKGCAVFQVISTSSAPKAALYNVMNNDIILRPAHNTSVLISE